MLQIFAPQLALHATVALKGGAAGRAGGLVVVPEWYYSSVGPGVRIPQW